MQIEFSSMTGTDVWLAYDKVASIDVFDMSVPYVCCSSRVYLPCIIHNGNCGSKY